MPSKNGIVRKVSVRFEDGKILDRPVYKLILLLSDDM
jgi:hypothetical protein